MCAAPPSSQPELWPLYDPELIMNSTPSLRLFDNVSASDFNSSWSSSLCVSGTSALPLYPKFEPKSPGEGGLLSSVWTTIITGWIKQKTRFDLLKTQIELFVKHVINFSYSVLTVALWFNFPATPASWQQIHLNVNFKLIFISAPSVECKSSVWWSAFSCETHQVDDVSVFRNEPRLSLVVE